MERMRLQMSTRSGDRETCKEGNTENQSTIVGPPLNTKQKNPY
jgi:hypothetical protein